jgi:EmrB/QacA subfamily drug resistance transporter
MTHRQILQALSGLLLALFISTLSSTVVSTALPKIIHSVHGSQTQYTWVVTSTLLTATATMPIWGKLADLFSKKALVQIAIVVFVLGSVGSGVSQSAGQLITARAVQGIGVGGLQSLVQIAIGAMISPRERGRYSGYLSSVTALATIGGPLLGGLIVDTSWLGWRWCFFIGIPIAAIALVLLQLTVHLPTISRENTKIDYLGATLITAAVSLLLIWISFVDSSFAWVSGPSAAMVAGSLALFALAVLVEARASEPVVPLGIVRQRTVTLAILGSLAAGTAMYGSSVFLSQYFQVARGYSPIQAGLLTIPMMVGILVSSVIAGRLLSRIGEIKPFIIAGTAFLTVGFGALSQIDHRTRLVFIAVAMVFVGGGVGMTVQNFTLVVQNAVPLKDIGAATSTVSFFRSLGGTIGVSVLGAVLARQVTHGLTLDRPRAAVYGDATGHIFLISAGVALFGVIAAVSLKPVTLRDSLDLPDTVSAVAVAAEVADGAPAPASLDVGTLPDEVPGRR